MQRGAPKDTMQRAPSGTNTSSKVREKEGKRAMVAHINRTELHYKTDKKNYIQNHVISSRHCSCKIALYCKKNKNKKVISALENETKKREIEKRPFKCSAVGLGFNFECSDLFDPFARRER